MFDINVWLCAVDFVVSKHYLMPISSSTDASNHQGAICAGRNREAEAKTYGENVSSMLSQSGKDVSWYTQLAIVFVLVNNIWHDMDTSLQFMMQFSFKYTAFGIDLMQTTTICGIPFMCVLSNWLMAINIIEHICDESNCFLVFLA